MRGRTDPTSGGRHLTSRASLTSNLRLLTGMGFLTWRTRPGERTVYYRMADEAWAVVVRRQVAGIAAFLDITRQGLDLVGAESDRAARIGLFAGYGSSLAVGGADLLGAALERDGDDIPTAVTEWEAELRREAEKKQKLGRRVKGVYAPRSPVVLELTQLPLRLSSWGPVRRMIERKFQLQG
ncbi:hypothetical protein [Microbispora sp. H10836]|uniref:hypothetical protein n=1 Tax=Microbispora sp. H10836 TaxID=2729106 RepID=UPI001B8D51B4|nr:hypothetical protein [Microbispora sp. H10836]